MFSSTRLFSSSTTENANDKDKKANKVSVETILKDNYPSFYSLLNKNENIFQQLDEDFGQDDGYTIFAPTDAAFQNLGEKKRLQLKDPRNLETAQKIGLYHVIAGEQLGYTQLNREDWTVPKTPEGLPALKFAAIQTLGGQVPIDRIKKKSDNFFAALFSGGTEKQSPPKAENEQESTERPNTQIILGPSATILRSLKIGNVIIHEVDDLISPTILWRYCDQLRIPGF